MTVANIAPGPESVSVEIHMPTATIPEAASRMNTPDARILARPSSTESDVPESVGIGWIPNTTPPASSPEAITISNSAPVNAIAAAYFDTISLVRRTGRTKRYRSVPVCASPAIASPANRPIATDMKNGWTRASPVSGANNPFRTICNRNGGASCAFWGGGGESRTAGTTRTGMPASAAARSHVRQRRSCFDSSTRNIDALHEMEEDVFQGVALRFERVYGDASPDQRGVHVGRPESVRQRDRQ